MRFEWGEMMCYSSQNRSQANCSQESDAHLLTLSAPIIPRPLVVSLSLSLLPSSSFFPPLPTHLESPTFFFFLLFWAAHFAQHEFSYRSERVSDLGFHSCYSLALMHSSRVFNSDWPSLRLLTCCCFDAAVMLWGFFFFFVFFFFFFLSLPCFHSISNSHIPSAHPFSKLFWIFLFLVVDRCVWQILSLLPQDAGSQQIGFLLGSCGVTLALTTDACQKGLPKAQTGEVATFKGTACFVFIVNVCA